MKKTIFFWLLILCMVFTAGAREFTVVSFEVDPSDLSARTNAVNDLNGNKCALIRVALPNDGGKFQGNVLKQDFYINEYRVYVSQGTKYLQLLYPGMETLKIDLSEYLGGQGVESGMTYRLKLSGYQEELISGKESTPSVKRKVAVYVTGDVRDTYKKVIGSQLVNAISNTDQYSAVDMTAEFMSTIEKNFGPDIKNVRDIQIVQIGKQYGVMYVVLADATDFGDQYYIDGRVVNLESSLIDKSYTVSGTCEDLNQVIALSKKLAEGLLGSFSESGNVSSSQTNGHEAIDLGLSVKWATCNIGASKPSDYGNYYAWGETETKSSYTDENSVTRSKRMNDIIGTQYDVAHTEWGGNWRLPTKAECLELTDKCKWQWTVFDGHTGYKVTGPNGNSIFLPAAGICDGDSAYDVRSFGNYWSSTPYSNDDTTDAWGITFNESYRQVSFPGRNYGLSVRPVSE